MGWPSTLTYRQLVARNVPRAVSVLAAYGDVDAAAALFAANPALADNPEALRYAASSGYEAFVRLLLAHQRDLARRTIVVAPTRALTEFLFDCGMDPNLPDWLCRRPLHRIAERGDIEKAAIFIEHGVDLDVRDEEWRSTPLGYAARSGKTAMVEYLLERGAKATLPDDPPWATPLAWATRRGHQDIIRLLTK